MSRRTNELRIAPGLALDADYVAGGSFGILSKKGAGKTYTGRILVEEMFAAKVQVVVVDPMGAWWGLRSSADGEEEGLPLPVFGGLHGDAPLEPSAGALMADLVVNEGLSLILDLKGFSSRTQERQFAAAFFDRLYRRNHDLVHLFIDEADLFAPQKPRGQDAPLLATVENIVRRGRNNGIGSTLITQRPAVLNKDVLTQIDGLVALRTTAPQDRDAIREWVRGQGDEEMWTEIAPSLPSLANGESWWWIPEKGVLKRVQVRASRTFDSSPTRKRGQRSRQPKTFADVDLEAISGQIAETIERAKERDPRELHKRLAGLERDLRAREQELARARARAEQPPPEQVSVAVLDQALVERLEQALDALGRPGEEIAGAADALAARLERAAEAFARPAQEVADAGAAITAALRAHSEQQQPTPQPARRQPARSAPTAAPSRADSADPVALESISPARQRLLDSLAALEGIGVPQVAKTQLALWAAVSPRSSGFQNNLGGLRTQALIDYPAPTFVALTDEGRAHADNSLAASLLTTEELHDHVRQLLSPARWRIVAPLLATYPGSMAKAALAEAAGVSPASSGFQNNLGGLRSLGLIDYPHPGHVVATTVLFLEGRAR